MGMSLKNRLNVREMGRIGETGVPTFLLAHGYGCDQTLWHPLVALLPEVRCVLFDWPGAGQAAQDSYDPVRHRTLDGYADDLIGLLDELAIPDVVYVGHSVAASIGALAAARAPALFGQLVMVAPSPCFLNDPPRYQGGFDAEQLQLLVQGVSENQAAWARSMAPVVMGNADRPGLTQELQEKFCQMDPTIAMRWAQATFLADVRPVIPQVTPACVVMQCQNDALASPEVGQWLHQALPVSRLVQMEASGHCPHVSAPAEVAQVLLRHAAWRG